MITIDYSDYIHVKEMSSYNDNFYKNKKDNMDILLHEVYDEDANIYTFSLYRNGFEFFLGHTKDERGVYKGIVTFNLGEFYT